MNPSFPPSHLHPNHPAAPTPRPAHKLLPASPQPRTKPAFRAGLAGLCGAFAAGLVLITAVTAQPPSKGTPQPAPTPTQQTFSGPAPVIINVDFPGGTVAQYCDAIRAAAAPTPVNILMNDEAASVVLPRLAMKQVSLDVALKAMSVIERPGNMPPVLIERLADGAASAAYVLKATGTGRSHGLSPRHTRVHSLRSIVEPPPGLPNTHDVAPPIETVMAALTAAAQVEDNKVDPAPDLMLHKESLVLVCRGTESQQEVVASVLKAIEGDLTPRRIAMAERVHRSEQQRLDAVTLQAEIRESQIMISSAEAELDYASKLASDRETQYKAGRIPLNELEMTKHKVVVAQNNLDTARTQQEMLISRRNILEARASAFGPAWGSEERRAVIYEISDLSGFAQSIEGLVLSIAGPGARVELTGHTLTVVTTPDQQEVLNDLMLTLRRVRANDPSFNPPPVPEQPGQDPAPPK